MAKYEFTMCHVNDRKIAVANYLSQAKREHLQEYLASVQQRVEGYFKTDFEGVARIGETVLTPLKERAGPITRD